MQMRDCNWVVVKQGELPLGTQEGNGVHTHLHMRVPVSMPSGGGGKPKGTGVCHRP